MRKVSLVVALVTSMLCLTAVAVAATNTYTVKGSIASGGSKSKPKPVAVNFDYSIGTDDGTLSNPVKTYKIHFAGLKFSPKSAADGKYCSAAKINAASSAAKCPSKTKVGTGEVNANVGSAGKPVDPNLVCNLKLDIYAGSSKSLALFLHGDPTSTPRCIAPISQAIDAKLTSDSKGSALTFTVPPVLLHPVAGLDSGITRVTSKIKKVGSGSKALFYSVGCKGNRSIDVTFTAENGAKETATASGGKC